LALSFPLRRLSAAVFACGCLSAQVIEFESGGLRYQTLSRNGVTIMFAPLPVEVRGYAILQVTVTNGSNMVCPVRPEDFALRLPGGGDIRAASAQSVVNNFLRNAGRNDVIRLVTTYEMGLYGLTRFRSTSGYEARRQAAQAEVTSTKLKAAAAASAIAFVELKLRPGESTDGAVFFATRSAALAGSVLRVTLIGQPFEFKPMKP
jgi:hypothetical protein